MIAAYFQQVQALLARIAQEQQAPMEAAALACADAIAAGGVIHLFGCGHSHLMCEEVFFRAGGLACVRPILHEPLMLHEGAIRSSALERSPGYGTALMREQEIRPGEVLFVVSTSGRNPVPVEVALAGREAGATVVAVTSLAYSFSHPSRHESGMRLAEAAHIAIDNGAPPGDASLTLPGFATPFAPVSTVAGTAILNAICARTVELLVSRGVEAPVFLSGNLDGADAHNRALAERYRTRVPMLS